MDTPNNNTTNEQKGSQNPSIQTHTVMGILAYLGILVIIPLLVSKNDPFVKFHIKQGLVLFCLQIIFWFIGSMMFWQLWQLVQLLNLAILVLAILGIVNVVQKKEKELPIVGGLASYFKF